MPLAALQKVYTIFIIIINISSTSMRGPNRFFSGRSGSQPWRVPLGAEPDRNENVCIGLRRRQQAAQREDATRPESPYGQKMNEEVARLAFRQARKEVVGAAVGQHSEEALRLRTIARREE